ncbi:MAG: DUF4160 domain-containing protein [Deltaproteobacteria bacterium]|nr:DUF4160 domain-containing protein [Deltaproteobacteria bacterium]
MRIGSFTTHQRWHAMCHPASPQRVRPPQVALTVLGFTTLPVAFAWAEIALPTAAARSSSDESAVPVHPSWSAKPVRTSIPVRAGRSLAGSSMLSGFVLRVRRADRLRVPGDRHTCVSRRSPAADIHVEYGEYAGVIEIATGRLLGGRLPPRVRRLVEEWRQSRRSELGRAWLEAQAGQAPRRVKPLE